MANINVSGRAEFISALTAAKGGDTIVLARGDYGSVQITGDYSSTVTIRSATPLAAKFSDLAFAGASNIRLDGVHVDNGGNGGPATSLIRIDYGSHHIQVVNSELNGKVDANYGGWQGIFVRDAEHVLLQNNNIHDVYRGMVNHGPDHLDVIGNRFSALGDDSMKFSGVTDVLIQNNFSSGPVVSGQHLDFIQFQGGAGTPSNDVTVQGNVFLVAKVPNVQGVFFGATVNDALIENNIIHTTMGNGIYAPAGKGITIRDNTVLDVAGVGHSVANIVASAGSFVDNNILSSWAGPSNNGIRSGNLVVQNTNPNAPYYVTDYYTNGDKGVGLTLAELRIVSGSLADTMGAVARFRELRGEVSQPAPPPTPDPVKSTVIYARAGAHEVGAAADVISVAHSGKFAVPAATVAFSFEADTVAGTLGLVTKDAYLYQGGGNHFATWIKNGLLSVMFESENDRKTFTVQNIKANQEYDLQAAFGNGKVSAWLDGRLIGTAAFDTDWSGNREYLHIGGHGGWSPTRGTEVRHIFDGTISDVRVVTGSLNPAQLAATAGSAAAPPGAEAAPVFSRPGASEFTGKVAEIVKVAHNPALEIDAGSIGFVFNADTVGAHQGLLSKDVAGSGDHFAAWLEGDVLKFRFEDGARQTVFQVGGIRANQDHEVLAVFDGAEVGLYVNDALIGKRAFAIDLATNKQALQIGGWDGAGTADDPFDGTISDVFIFDQAFTPQDVPLL